MFRMWVKILKDNHLLKDVVIEDGSNETRTHKIFGGIDEVCHKFDLSRPIWLDSNIQDFKKYSRTRFGPDCFIDGIDFDFMEIQMIEED